MTWLTTILNIILLFPDGCYIDSSNNFILNVRVLVMGVPTFKTKSATHLSLTRFM